MITLKDFMETVEYKVTEGSNYCWECYGPNAYRLDSWNQEQDGHTVSIVFDTQTQVVYETTAYDYAHNRAYRLINPDYKQVHDSEAKQRDVDAKQAWDDVNYTDLEVVEDFLEKARAIITGEEYDTRVHVPIEFTDEDLFEYMKLAHQRDITFNQLVEEALRYAISEFERDPEAMKEMANEWKAVHVTNTDNPIDFPMRSEYDFADAERGPVKQSIKKIKNKKKGK